MFLIPEDKIEVSKFCQLRPKECITVGHRGTHSVCVCVTHQNVKLMAAALPGKVTYHDLMNQVACNEESKMCMIHRCPHCPGTDALTAYLESLFDESDLSADEPLTFRQWVSTDHTTIQAMTSSLHSFIEMLVKKVDDLTAHHFIAKHQSKFITDLKSKLSPNEILLILDFAENYSFVVQDAAQGFHWNNSQATLHPFVGYFKNAENEVEHISMCVKSKKS